MHKIINKVKRSVALFSVFLLSFGSFAAVVSDNDGSAFITKAEFDSLKNNFQSQIDQYNTSIDAKIDGAIAAYLAGIKVTTTETYEVPIDNYKDMKWVNDLWVYAMQDNWAAGSTTDKTTDTWSWRQVHWGNYRNIRHGGIDLNSVWLNAGNKRDAHWQMHIDPDVSTNQYFGSSDFLSNRINRLSIPVLVLDLPLIGGYNVLKDGDDKIFLESM